MLIYWTLFSQITVFLGGGGRVNGLLLLVQSGLLRIILRNILYIMNISIYCIYQLFLKYIQ